MNGRVTDTFINRCLEFELKVTKEQPKVKWDKQKVTFMEITKD